MPHEPEILVFTQEKWKHVDTKTYTRMFLASLFKTAKTGDNSSIHQDEWINKMESICAINTFQLEWTIDTGINLDE